MVWRFLNQAGSVIAWHRGDLNRSLHAVCTVDTSTPSVPSVMNQLPVSTALGVFPGSGCTRRLPCPREGGRRRSLYHRAAGALPVSQHPQNTNPQGSRGRSLFSGGPIEHSTLQAGESLSDICQRVVLAGVHMR